MKFLISNFQFSKLLGIIILVSLLFFPLVSLAGGLVPCGGPGEPPCQFCHLFVLLKNIVDFFLIPRPDINQNIPLVPLIATVMLVIGGAMFFFYAENPTRTQQAQSLIVSVVIGFIIIYGAWLIINFFFQVIGVQQWTGLERWWEIKCP